MFGYAEPNHILSKYIEVERAFMPPIKKTALGISPMPLSRDSIFL